MSGVEGASNTNVAMLMQHSCRCCPEVAQPLVTPLLEKDSLFKSSCSICQASTGSYGKQWGTALHAWRVSVFAQGKICCLVSFSGFPWCQYDLREPLSFNNAENKSPLKYMHLKEPSSQPDCRGVQAPSHLCLSLPPLSFKAKLGGLLLQEACPDSS